MNWMILGLMGTLALDQVVQQPLGLGTEPAKFDQLLENACLRRDLAFVEAVVADEVRVIHGTSLDRPVETKRQFLDAVRFSEALERNVDSVQVEEHGEIMRTRGHVQVKTLRADGPEYQVYFVRIYQRRSSGWQLVSDETVRQLPGPVATPSLPIRNGDTESGTGSGTAMPTPPGVFRPGNGVALPRVVREVKPRYTREAMGAQIEGAVLMQAVVKADGTVGDVAVLRSLDRTYGLDEEAIKAAKQWQFLPGTRAGQPVPVLVTIELTFTLRKN